MKRVLVPTVLALALAPPAAHAIIVRDYQGGVVGEPGSSIEFNVKKNDAGKRRVRGMLIDNLPYKCKNDPPGTSEFMKVVGSFAIKARRFSGTREATPDVPVDPTAKLTGRLKPGGKARGTIRLRGELGGAGTKCHTGELIWKAAKNKPI